MSLLNSNIFKIYAFEVLLFVITKCSAHDCETLTTEIHIQKDEYQDDMLTLIRSCSGEISVNKCEGTCNSQLQPSLGSPTGFLKECQCCRESYFRDRTFTLTHCYAPDGVRYEDDERAIMEIRLREPVECKCSKCGDSSR